MCLPLHERLLKVAKETEHHSGDLAKVEGLCLLTDNVLVLVLPRLQPWTG